MIELRVNNVKELKGFEEVKYKDIDLNRLSVFAIWLLKENQLPITIQSITVASFKMFPTKFSLIDYPEYPDVTRVNRALMQLTPKYRNWATGNVKQGYVLTKNGKFILEQTKNLLQNPKLQKKLRESSLPRSISMSDMLKDVEKTTLFKKYINNQKLEATKFDFWDFFHAFSYTPKKVLIEYKEKVKNIARQEKREDIQDFIKWLEETFGKLLKNN